MRDSELRFYQRFWIERARGWGMRITLGLLGSRRLARLGSGLVRKSSVHFYPSGVIPSLTTRTLSSVLWRHFGVNADGPTSLCNQVPRFLQRGEGSYVQPAQRVSQAESPLCFWCSCMLRSDVFFERFPRAFEFPRGFEFRWWCNLAYAPGRLSGRSFATPVKRLRSG